MTRLIRVEQLLAGVEVNKLGVLCGDHSSGTYNIKKKKKAIQWLASFLFLEII
jgi:hypothetical protein